MQQVSFSVAGQKLVGTVQYPEYVNEKNPAILLVHGWMSSQKRNILYAQELTKLGFIVMTFDLRSHGESEGNRGQLSRSDYLNDMVAAYDVLVLQKGVDEENIGVIGSSFGSYLAVILTTKRAIKWLALRVPANYPEEGFDQPQVKYANAKTTAWRSEKLHWSATHSLRALHAFNGEVLIIESELDTLCPHQTMENYIHAVQDQKKLTHKIMKGADHSIKSEKLHAVFTQILINWLHNVILKA